ncbi:CKLF-like MARVEL transmembrane domain-containing protein 7 isoform X1 [Heteronotia binoei]|uniref:CKLF-like MARVEL transmembrane domain-containing protein 7 isoform X1 n=1 Tax=Heteronotia binoei TaxID=13085 RepID=UPI002931D9EC|nr:CKLF-like MARVEL transmembrane domain-containing protein 7 isoform X1 [Heteronotia binoei]
MSHGAPVIRTDVSSAGASTSSSPPDSGRLDRAYVSSCTAMLKVVQMLLLLIAFICIRNSVWTDYSAYSYFEIVTMCDFIMILVFYIVYLFRVYRLLTCINWPLAEFLHYLIGTILLLIACFVAAAKSYNSGGLVAGATFGFLATFLCILSIWLSYKVSCVTQSTVFKPSGKLS